MKILDVAKFLSAHITNKPYQTRDQIKALYFFARVTPVTDREVQFFFVILMLPNQNMPIDLPNIHWKAKKKKTHR